MTFEELRPQIEAELEKRIPSFEEDFILITGFANLTLALAPDEITIGAPVIPLVMLVERSTGKIEFFAFKHFGLGEE